MEHRDLIRKQFDRQANIYANMEQTQDTQGHDLIVALCEASSEHRILDVACGPGFLTRRFARVSKEVVGIDITDAFLEMATSLAQKEGLDNVRFIDGDVNELPFDANSFDIVSCRAAFHHFPDPARVLAEMSRVVKVGGTLSIGDLTTSENPAKAEYQHKMEMLCDPSHIRAITMVGFRKLITEAGLELKNEFQGTQNYDLEDWIKHGSPLEDAAMEIRKSMQAAIGNDLCDLDVRLEADVVKFTHETVLFLATKPAP